MKKLAIAAAMILCVSVPGADKSPVVETVVVYKEAGRFGGWPANNGMYAIRTHTSAPSVRTTLLITISRAKDALPSLGRTNPAKTMLSGTKKIANGMR